MSGDSFQAQKADWIRPPRAGVITVLATSNVAATIDLRTIGNQSVGGPSAGGSPPTDGPALVGTQRRGLVGHYIRVWALTVDCYVAFGPTAASVGSIAAATTGSNGANCCVPIFAGTYEDFLIADDPVDAAGVAKGPETFLGYVTASGTGTLRIAQASP